MQDRTPVAVAGIIAAAILWTGYANRDAATRHHAAVMQEQRCGRLVASLPEVVRERLLAGRYSETGRELEMLVGAEALTGARIAECSPMLVWALPEDRREIFLHAAEQRFHRGGSPRAAAPTQLR
jgi:hypothetical protein